MHAMILSHDAIVRAPWVPSYYLALHVSRLYGGALLDPLIGGGLETAPISLELFGAVELKPWSRD